MKCFIGVDPGMSGGYAIAYDSLQSIELHSWVNESSFVEHFLELLANPDITSISTAVEKVPPYVGRAIPSSSSFKLGYNYGFIVGVFRALKLPIELIPPKDWQKGLGGLQGLSSNKRKKVLKDHANRFFPTVKGLILKTADAALILRHFFINNQSVARP